MTPINLIKRPHHSEIWFTRPPAAEAIVIKPSRWRRSFLTSFERDEMLKALKKPKKNGERRLWVVSQFELVVCTEPLTMNEVVLNRDASIRSGLKLEKQTRRALENKFEGDEERLSQSFRWAVMSERAETCWKRVNECQRLALVAFDTEIRLMYLELATQWRELAEYIETPDTPGGATIHKSSGYGDRDAAIAQVCLAPTVSAITAPRAPKGFSSPTVESRAV
jgi:hypothetical protein